MSPADDLIWSAEKSSGRPSAAVCIAGCIIIRIEDSELWVDRIMTDVMCCCYSTAFGVFAYTRSGVTLHHRIL